MARARNIKPGFFQNDLLAEIDPLGRLLFAGLWTIADRAGRLEDRPKRIKAAVLPYDNCDLDNLLNELAKRGFILRYEVGGEQFIEVQNFVKHQNPHCKEPESTIPAPGQVIGGIVGAVVGFFTPIGPVMGAQIEMAAGSLIEPPADSFQVEEAEQSKGDE